MPDLQQEDVPKTPMELLQDIHDRMVRVETRLTRMMLNMGMNPFAPDAEEKTWEPRTFTQT